MRDVKKRISKKCWKKNVEILFHDNLFKCLERERERKNRKPSHGDDGTEGRFNGRTVPTEIAENLIEKTWFCSGKKR